MNPNSEVAKLYREAQVEMATLRTRLASAEARALAFEHDLVHGHPYVTMAVCTVVGLAIGVALMVLL